MQLEPRAHPSFSLPSILAVVAAVLSFNFGATLGLVFAIVAIVLGALGVLLALSPRIRGGMISIVSILAGVVGIVAAVFKFLTLNL